MTNSFPKPKKKAAKKAVAKKVIPAPLPEPVPYDEYMDGSLQKAFAKMQAAYIQNVNTKETQDIPPYQFKYIIKPPHNNHGGWGEWTSPSYSAHTIIEDDELMGVSQSGMDEPVMNWKGSNLSILVSSLNKSHQSVLFVVCDKEFASKTQERIQSLVGSLNRSPDYGSGGTIKADVYTIVSPEEGFYTIYHGLLTDYENIEATGSISIPTVLISAKQRWTMAAFAV
jgi:hypothetical protein